MNTVVLHQGRLFGDAIKQKRDQYQVVLIRQLFILGVEGPCVAGPVVRRNLDACQNHLGTGLLAHLYHALQVLPDAGHRQTAQTIIAAQFQDHDVRLMGFQHGRQPGQAAGGGFATDTAIDDLYGKILLVQALLQQRHPAVLLVHAIGSAQAVAEYQ